MPILLDLAPLRASPAYRRLYTGFTLAGVGSQLTVVAIGLQVYGLTGSSFSVGLVGLFALVPIIIMGLYGGALIDAHDRRIVALVASAVMWASGILTMTQAWLGNTNPLVLYLLVAVNSAGFAVVSPARSAIYPRLLARHLLPAANALTVFAFNVALTVGPLLAGFLVAWRGYTLAYGVDVVLFTAAMWGLFRLPPIPPQPHPEALGSGRPGLASVLDGLRFLGTRPNVRMTFLSDFCAMVLAMPRALFPAVAVLTFGGGARTVGYLASAVAVGSIVAMVFSGKLGHLRRQGLAVVVCVALWGVSISGFGISVALAGGMWTRSSALLVGAFFLACAGAADSISAVFRTTILQAATPDHLRGRLQGVFIVVVAGGPRLGDLVSGSVATVSSEAFAAIAGGIACAAAVVALTAWQRGFLRYDAEDPTP
ncbi:MAG: MFS transporter [Phycicoccus sp.]|nr:MFS transporter [Phycicoccus sp.]